MNHVWNLARFSQHRGENGYACRHMDLYIVIFLFVLLIFFLFYLYFTDYILLRNFFFYCI